MDHMLRTLGIALLPPQRASAANVLARCLGGRPLVQWVVRRLTDCQRLDGVIVALDGSPPQRQLASLVPSDVPTFVCRDNGARDPVLDALAEFPAEAVVRVRLDHVFVDPTLVDRLVTTADAHPECDCVSYCSRSGQPAIHSPLGMFADWCRTDALRRAAARVRTPEDRRDVCRFIYAHPEQFRLRLIPIPPQLDRDDVRLAVDSDEDWEHAQTIIDALGADDLDWQSVADLLDQQPALRRRMADMNRSAVGASPVGRLS